MRQFLAETLDAQVREAINQDWTTLKAYLHIGKGSERWYVDREDPEELAVEGRLHRTFFLADSKGNVLDISEVYKTLGADSKSQILKVVGSKQPLWEEKVDPHGEHFLIRAGFDTDEDTPDRTYYYVAIGRSLKSNQEILKKFTWLGAALIPLIALGGCLLGWIYAGRALSPVMNIARTAQRISGMNLSMRIPTRKSGDELDYLIETFNRMIERLELSFNQIRQFSTDVSHELRTPDYNRAGSVGSRFIYGQDIGGIPRGDCGFAARYRASFRDRARAAAALAGGDGASGSPTLRD